VAERLAPARMRGDGQIRTSSRVYIPQVHQPFVCNKATASSGE
jgi:hypothetical protein